METGQVKVGKVVSVLSSNARTSLIPPACVWKIAVVL